VAQMKNTSYFPHDENARNDQKLLKLRAKYGLEGYGLWWCILETMAADSNGYLDGSAMAGLSLSYGIAIEKLQEIIVFLESIELLIKCDHGNFYNNRMLEHKNFRKERSASGKKGAESTWKDHINSSAIKQLIASKVKESKVKESKVKESKEEDKREKHRTPTLFSFTLEQFSSLLPDNWSPEEKTYWYGRAEAYSNKGNKYINWVKAIENWRKENPGQYKPDNGFKLMGS
jgi:hypothetical protein